MHTNSQSDSQAFTIQTNLLYPVFNSKTKKKRLFQRLAQCNEQEMQQTIIFSNFIEDKRDHY